MNSGLRGYVRAGDDPKLLEFRVLGPVEAVQADRRVDIGHARQRSVLAVLLLDLGRVVPTERLIDRVWGEDPPASARNVLYGYVARLKSAIIAAGDPGVVLARQAGGYLLEAGSERLDLLRFRSLAGEAAASADDGKQAAALLRSGLGLWRGTALAGLSGRWLEARRDAMELERRTAFLDLTDIALRQGEHAALISELTEAATALPTDERLIGQLMLALYRSGRQADALRWFDETRRWLGSELGADPGPALQRLHQQILRMDPALAVPHPGDAAGHISPPAADRTLPQAPAPLTPRELPTDVPAFTGRAAELAELSRLLAPAESAAAASDSGTRLGTVAAVIISAVSGTAGVGKTALAVHWAHQVARHFPDGQLYANLRGYDPGAPASPGDVLAGFLRALGVGGQDIPADTEERAARYRSLMAGRRMLVVLDNAGDAEQVRPLLPGASTCRVVVTSRDDLAGLVARDGALRLDLDLLPAQDAVGLLRALIGTRADSDPQSAAVLADLCARLPLALRVAAELAATRPAATLAELVSELADQRRRLDLLDAGGDPRAAVRAVFSWSYRNLDAADAGTFRLLGLDPGPDLDRWAAAALANATAEQVGRRLDRLARAHLIQVTRPGRYGMHDLLRAYALDLATAQDGEHEARQALARLLDHYQDTAATAMDALFPAEQPRERSGIPAAASPDPPVADSPVADPAAARAWLDAQLASLVSAAAHAAAHGWPGHAVRLASLLFSYLDRGGHYAVAVALHGHARTAAQLAGDQAAEVTALVNLGVVHVRLGSYPHASEFFRLALASATEPGSLPGKARALGNLGVVATYQGQPQQASSYLAQALVLYRQTGNRIAEARVLVCLGDLSRLQGDYQQATGHFEEAMAVARQMGDRTSEAFALDNLADVKLRLGLLQQATGHLQRALAIHRENGDRSGEGHVLEGLGRVEFKRGEYGKAAEFAHRALAFYRESGERDGEPQALNDLGEIYFATGDADRARTQYATALSLASQADVYEQARAHDGLGHCWQAAADLEQARHHWREALVRYTSMGAPEASEVRACLMELARHGAHTS